MCRTKPGIFGIFSKRDPDCLQCKDSCDGLFPGDAQLRNGCKDMCEAGNTDINTQDDYLSMIGQGTAQVVDELNSYNQQAQQAETAQNQIYLKIAGGAIIAILIMVLIKNIK